MFSSNASKLFCLTMLLAAIFYSGKSQSKTIRVNDTLTLNARLTQHDEFESGLSNWIVEQQPGGNVEISEGKMEITDASGCTVWFREKLSAPCMIEYDAMVIGKGGPHDRVSDLNCFWMALDPENQGNFFHPKKERKGKFSHYHSLRLYYVGVGGHNNSTTRFRRYPGDGTRPLLPEHDLTSEKYLITPNIVNRIRIIVYKNLVQYYLNDELFFSINDPAPYHSGYFGIRTVNNHMTVDDFRVYSITE